MALPESSDCSKWLTKEERNVRRRAYQAPANPLHREVTAACLTVEACSFSTTLNNELCTSR